MQSLYEEMKTEPRKWQLIIVLALFWTLLGLSFGAISYSVAADGSKEVRAFPVFLMNFIKFYLWAALAPVIFVITKRFNFERRDTFLISFAVHLTACVLLAGIHSNVYSIIVWAFNISYFGSTPSIATLFQDFLFFGNFYLGVLLYTLIVIIVQAYLFFDKQQAETMRNAEMQAELANAQLQALKMQLQPHFLFNALHSISSLNLVDPPKANRMIARLGEFLRLTLERSDEQMVTLNEELDFLRYYLEIEQIRFSDRLTVEFDIDAETISAEVPHLILQPLVENAVKHGIAPFAGEGRIKIRSQKIEKILLLQVKNDGAKNRVSLQTDGNSSGGTGLKNVRSRLVRIYGESFRFELSEGTDDGMTVDLEIPFAVETDAILLD